MEMELRVTLPLCPLSAAGGQACLFFEIIYISFTKGSLTAQAEQAIIGTMLRGAVRFRSTAA